MKTLTSKKRHSHRNLPHFESAGDIIFITINNETDLFLSDLEKDLILSAIKYYDQKLYTLIATVVMATHSHLIIKINCKYNGNTISMSTGVARIKSYTAKQLRKLFRPDQVNWWIEDYFDKTIIDGASFTAVMDYLKENPVKAGIVNSIAEYKWYFERQPIKSEALWASLINEQRREAFARGKIISGG